MLEDNQEGLILCLPTSSLKVHITDLGTLLTFFSSGAPSSFPLFILFSFICFLLFLCHFAGSAFVSQWSLWVFCSSLNPTECSRNTVKWVRLFPDINTQQCWAEKATDRGILLYLSEIGFSMKNQRIVSMSAHKLTINEFSVNKIYSLGNIQSTFNLVVMFAKEFMINPLLPQT